jgi:hypothetical protein
MKPPFARIVSPKMTQPSCDRHGGRSYTVDGSAGVPAGDFSNRTEHSLPEPLPYRIPQDGRHGPAKAPVRGTQNLILTGCRVPLTGRQVSADLAAKQSLPLDSKAVSDDLCWTFFAPADLVSTPLFLSVRFRRF